MLSSPGALAGAANLWDVLLSVGIFAAVWMLIVSIFSQPGKVEMSPERQVAIATGHTDRKSLFENPILRPVLWLLLAVAHKLAMERLKQWLGRKLIAAGNPNYYTAEEYLALAMLAGVVLAIALEIAHLLAYLSFSFSLMAAGPAIGIALSLYQLYDAASRRIRLISKRVPYALDLIALAMGAGATFIEAVRTVVREEPTDPFNVELTAMLAEMNLGATRRRALENLAERIPLDSLRAIIASVVQAEQLGTPLADVLHEQATLMRTHRSIRAEHEAAVASVRILLPCLLLVMAVILAIFGPAIVQVVRGGLF